MYDYETAPPAGVWEAIAFHLDGNEAKVIPLQPKKRKRFYYVAAASAAIILFGTVFFAKHHLSAEQNAFFSWGFSDDKPKKSANGINTFYDTTAAGKDGNVMITVPADVDSAFTDKKDIDDDFLAKNIPVKGGPNENIKKEEPKKTDTFDNKSEAKKIIAGTHNARYITIEGLQGQPVKVSSKMASLMDSADENVPPKPTWNKKINEWREIMKGNTVAPTPGNFLDILELTKTLKDHKP